MGNKVRVLNAPVEIVRDYDLESRYTYFRSSIRILFMPPVFGLFEEFWVSLDVEVSVFKISIFFPDRYIGNQSQCEVMHAGNLHTKYGLVDLLL